MDFIFSSILFACLLTIILWPISVLCGVLGGGVFCFFQ